ncbi:spondin-2-like [Liolophura sinensis]|uniref:spondin-2-like n=1 Tax=Liolophura sinensis TaxID=3198878 RepID=UPI003157FC03
MMSICLFVVVVALACQTLSTLSEKLESSGCEYGEIVRYNITFVAEWSPRKFPKMFPRYRPPAQWSKLIGRTHSPKYTMWEMGELASPALKMLAEEGDAAVFDRQSQGHNGIFDAFTAAPLPRGMGQASSKIFLDGLHSKVSLVVKMIPSPDWFVGISDFDLCQNGQWRDLVRLRLDPIDAGTDKGLTFTSPNWPSLPQEPVHHITSQRPNHIASAFYYPKLKKLRRIGYLIFQKLLSYERENKPTHTVSHNQRQRQEVVDQPETRPETTGPGVKAGPFKDPIKELPVADGIVLSDAPSDTRDDDREAIEQKSQGNPPVGQPHLETSRDDEDEEGLEGVATPLHCIVSDWSAWSPCSKTCGFGQKERTRLIIQKPQNGGTACPTLVQTSLCGSMRNCRWKHFRFQKWRSG